MTTDPRALDPENEPAPGGAAPVTVVREKTDIRHVALIILTVLALLYTLRFAQAFFLPIVLAILLNFLLSPVVRLLRNALRIPEPLGAAVILIVLLGVIAFGFYQLAPAASGAGQQGG